MKPIKKDNELDEKVDLFTMDFEYLYEKIDDKNYNEIPYMFGVYSNYDNKFDYLIWRDINNSNYPVECVELLLWKLWNKITFCYAHYGMKSDVPLILKKLLNHKHISKPKPVKTGSKEIMLQL